jgi:hypothetical protein
LRIKIETATDTATVEPYTVYQFGPGRIKIRAKYGGKSLHPIELGAEASWQPTLVAPLLECRCRIRELSAGATGLTEYNYTFGPTKFTILRAKKESPHNIPKFSAGWQNLSV